MIRRFAFIILLLLPGISSAIVLTTITIDGNFSDWDSVLSNQKNTVTDPYRNAGDLDHANISSDSDDLRLIAATWDANNFYFYFQTSKANNSSVTFLVYVDADHDGKMKNSASSDRVLGYKFTNSSLQVAAIYNYVPVNPTGDVMGGDGSAMPGGVSQINPTPPGMTADGNLVEFEARISWAGLGLGGPTAPNLKVSTKGGSQLLDNTGLLDLLVSKVFLFPDNAGESGPNSLVQYQHTVSNQSTGNDVVNISASSSQAYSISFERWNGSAWVAMLDADNNGIPDLGNMAASTTALLRVTLHIPAALTPTIDTITVVATSSVNTSVSADAVDTTTIGDISVSPNQAKSAQASDTVKYSHIVANHLGTDVTIDLSTSSNPGWTTAVYLDSDCDGVEEGSSITELSDSANSSHCVVATVDVPPGTPSGTVHTLVLIAAVPSLALSAEATDTTTAADRLVLAPEGNSTITGAGSAIYYVHTLSNNQAFPDSFNLTAVPTLGGWTAEVFEEDGVTPLSSVGPLPAFGGSATFKVKVTASVLALLNDVDITTVTASSNTGPATDSVEDTTKISFIATYENYAATFPRNAFSPCSVVYARGFNLTGSDYRVRWYDPDGVVKSEIVGVPPDANHQINDSYQLLPGDLLGAWAVEIAKKSGNSYGAPIYTEPFTVVLSGTIDSLTTNSNTYFYQGNTISVTAMFENHSTVVIPNSLVVYLIYKDLDSSGTPTNGDLFLTSSGQTDVLDGSTFTHVTNLSEVVALQSNSIRDQFSIANANFGAGNAGTWKVHAVWKTTCGDIVDDSTLLNVTFQVIAGCTPTAIVGPLSMEKSGGDELISWSAVSDPCLASYVVLGSSTPNPPDWDLMVEAEVAGTFYLGTLGSAYYQVVVKSIDGSLGPR